MDEECPICLEEIGLNLCCTEICLTCRKIFHKSCTNPEHHQSLETCPHCKTNFTLSLNEDIDRALKIIKRDDFKHKSLIHYILFLLYRNKEDKEKSFEHLNKSYELNYNCAYTAMANKYLDEGNQEEYERNIKLGTDNGCFTASISQAEIEYSNKNYQRCKELLTSASENNQTEAQYLLGSYIYENKLDGEVKDAISWLTKAADRNHYEACFYLANIYYSRNQEDDYKLAIKYIKKAAENGHAHAQLNYAISLQNDGMCYKAIEWYNRAYNNGKEEAMVKIAICHFQMKDLLGDFIYYEGLKILENEVEKEVPEALYELGRLNYLGNQYIKRNDNEAFRLFNKAAELNYPKAFLNLYEMYMKGIGVERNINKGYQCITRYLFLSANVEDFDINQIQVEILPL
jgi:TPR repeat protein